MVVLLALSLYLSVPREIWEIRPVIHEWRGGLYSTHPSILARFMSLITLITNDVIVYYSTIRSSSSRLV